VSTDPDARFTVLAESLATSSSYPVFSRSEVRMPTLRVSAGSRPNAVAGAVAALLRLDGSVEMQAIGPHAVNQAVKSLAIARAYLVQDDLDLRAAPGFVKLELHDEERTAMRFEVWAVPLGDRSATSPVPEPGGVDEPGDVEPRDPRP